MNTQNDSGRKATLMDRWMWSKRLRQKERENNQPKPQQVKKRKVK